MTKKLAKVARTQEGSLIECPRPWNMQRWTMADLKAIGCSKWDDSGLMLFPKSWYNEIPEGYIVHVINGTVENFKRGVTDDDTRFGMLAYGVYGADSKGRSIFRPPPTLFRTPMTRKNSSER